MKKPQKKQLLFGLVIIVVIIITTTTAVLFSQYQASIQPADIKKTKVDSQKTVVEKKSDDAMKKAYEGDAAGGAAELDAAIAATNDSNEKYIFYSRKATLLYNSQDLPGALAAALKAYEFKKSSDSAALVGQFSRESGNTTQAIEYYKKAIELIDKADPYWDEDSVYYKAIVAELEGGKQ